VKTFSLKFTHASLFALVAALTLLTSTPSRADNAPTVQAPPPPAPAVSVDTRLAWDRVGSQDRGFA
jgi:hypothetical protein